jgi:hypothetical protein
MGMRLSSGLFAWLQQKPSRLNESDVKHYGIQFYDSEMANILRAGFQEVFDVRYLAFLYPDELSALTYAPVPLQC